MTNPYVSTGEVLEALAAARDAMDAAAWEMRGAGRSPKPEFTAALSRVRYMLDKSAGLTGYDDLGNPVQARSAP